MESNLDQFYIHNLKSTSYSLYKEIIKGVRRIHTHNVRLVKFNITLLPNPIAFWHFILFKITFGI